VCLCVCVCVCVCVYHVCLCLCLRLCLRLCLCLCGVCVCVLCLGADIKANGTAWQLPFFVTEIDTNGPAGMDGRMRVGDVLLRVQDTNVSGMTTNQVTDLVRGEPGSVVSLTLSRAEFSAEETRLREELGASSGAPPAQRQGRARKILSLDLKRGSPGEDGQCVFI